MAASLALLLLSLGAAVGAPAASITGNASLVYSFYASHCPPLPAPGCSTSIAEGCDCDIADAPLRMWRRSGGDGRVISLASVDLGSRPLVGASPLTLAHECALYANSTREQAFAQYANYEWIHSSWYFAENNSVVALTHMEWDCKNADSCAFYGMDYSCACPVETPAAVGSAAPVTSSIPTPLSPHPPAPLAQSFRQ